MTNPKPYLNAGCGTIILPDAKPPHYILLDEICDYPVWVNADRNDGPGVDCITNLWEFPWPWPDNHFAGGLFAHIMEHVPHSILPGPLLDALPSEWRKTVNTCVARHPKYLDFQDGWYSMAFEIWRVLEPGAIAHILVPYAWSDAGMTDPTHTRYLTEHVWLHGLEEDDGKASFHYQTGGAKFEMVESPRFQLTGLTPEAQQSRDVFTYFRVRNLNVAHHMYTKLRVIK